MYVQTYVCFLQLHYLATVYSATIIDGIRNIECDVMNNGAAVTRLDQIHQYFLIT